MPLIISPAILIMVARLTKRVFPGSQGSGIPQAIATLEMQHDASRAKLLSVRVVLGKIALIVRGLILAGGAAGIAAAFDTPLAGIVFAIEEMSQSFEERTGGTLLTAVVIAGVTTVAVQDNYIPTSVRSRPS